MDPEQGTVRTLTFIPLFGEREDPRAARWLREVSNPAARVPVRVAVMPRSGISFFEATGDAALQLDRTWSQAVPADTTPVVVTLHHPALPKFLDGLDVAFVVGVPDGDVAPLYRRHPHVQVVDSPEPSEVLLAAARAWNDPRDPAFILSAEAPGGACRRPLEPRPPESPEPPDPDSDFFAQIFGDRPDPFAEGDIEVPSEPWDLPPAPEAEAEAPTHEAGGGNADPLAALAALKPVPLERSGRDRPAGGRRRRVPEQAPDPPDEVQERASRGFLQKLRRAVGHRRAIQVPGEIGDLLLGTRPAPLVVVGSRKGGVGKTALSAGLAQVAGYALDGRAGVAALVDQNINNADQWGRLRLPEGVTTVREVMAKLEQGEDFGAAPAYARTPALAVFPESRDPGDGYPPVLIERFVGDLRSRYVFTVIDLPNSLPAFTSAEASVAASYIAHADLVLVPTSDDPNALRGALEYLTAPSMRRKAAIVPYIVSTERGIRDHPKVLELLDEIREHAVAVVPFPRTERATLAVVKGASVLDVDARLRSAYIDLAATVARVLVRGL